eukprot:212382_1
MHYRKYRLRCEWPDFVFISNVTGGSMVFQVMVAAEFCVSVIGCVLMNRVVYIPVLYSRYIGLGLMSMCVCQYISETSQRLRTFVMLTMCDMQKQMINLCQ